MKIAITLQRIFLSRPNKNAAYVTYENQFQPRMIFGNDALKQLFYEHEAHLMALTEKEISDYVNAEDLCNDEEGMFPQPKYLTGEWYVSEIHFEEPNDLDIETTMLGTDWGCKTDYLCLDLNFEYDETLQKFICGGINSRSL